jgi:imidazoleglycerol phosphate synthase glutamine amidotransferase subunit HisH
MKEGEGIAAEHAIPFHFIWRDNLTACQLHHEKNQTTRLATYANFVATG